MAPTHPNKDYEDSKIVNNCAELPIEVGLNLALLPAFPHKLPLKVFQGYDVQAQLWAVAVKVKKLGFMWLV